MKKKFMVELIKVKRYHVEAEGMDEAEQLALDMDADKDAEIKWVTDPYEEFRVEEE